MRPMALVFVALFNSILGLSVLFPIFGPLGRDLGLSEIEIGCIYAGYALMQLIFAPAWGRRSEKVGRKPVLLTGVIGFAGGFLAFALVAELGMRGVLGHWPLFGLLMASRIIGGAFSSATLPTAQAYAADVSDRSSRTSAMAVIGAAFGLGIVFGPAIGAGVSWAADSLLAPVYLSVSVAVLNAIFIALRLPEPERAETTKPPGSAREHLKRIWPLLALSLVATLASVAMEQTIAFYFMDRLGISEEAAPPYVGLALVIYGVVAVIAQGFIVRRAKMRAISLVRAGLPIALLGYVLLPLAHDFWLITAAMVTQGLGQGLLLPGVTASISLASGDGEQGSAAGLNSSATGLGRLFGPLIGTGLYGLGKATAWLGPGLPYMVSAGLVGALLLLVLARPRIVPDQRSEKTPSKF